MIYGIGFMISSICISFIIIINIFDKGIIEFIETNKILLSIELFFVIIAFISLPFMIYYTFKGLLKED